MSGKIEIFENEEKRKGRGKKVLLKMYVSTSEILLCPAYQAWINGYFIPIPPFRERSQVVDDLISCFRIICSRGVRLFHPVFVTNYTVDDSSNYQ
jgi:hypothetical protein